MHATPTNSLERAGQASFWASLACAVHCLLTAVLVAIAPSLARSLAIVEWVERPVLALALAVGAVVVGRSAWQQKRVVPVAVFLVGALLVVVGQTIPGSLLVGSAQLLNLHYHRRRARACAC